MTRVFHFIVLLAFACVGAADALAQSRRVYRVEPPKEERAKETETRDAPKDDSGSKAGDEAKDKPRDEARAGDDDEPVASREVTTRAVIKSKPQPIFPYEARSRGVEGAVKLRIILGSNGKVREKMQVLEGLPYGMTEQAMKAALRIEFIPARKDGRPVSQYVTVIYHFNLY